jgi:tetratricopeptide (TPR) repeat protein
VELLYNPDVMLEEEIKATFVARHGLIEELVALVAQQPDGAGVQHVVIIAPRGMGKTTVLLMVQFAVRDGDLKGGWQAVKFAEESYGIYDLSDFWIEALTRLAAETEDDELLERTEKLRKQYRDSEDLQEAALAVIKEWRRKHGKRLVLLVDNFDMILEQINDERDNARLRDVLMNDGTVMLIGGATTFFREARAYDQPLYNFFKILNLDNLRFAQMQDLLRRRAEIDKVEDFEKTLKANEGRLRVLEYFTGGNPRLVLMLYRVVSQSDISEVRRGLEKLLDEATPFYKAKVESLPPQQRKILDHIARESSRTHEGVTPTAIAEATRLKPNLVSSQLKRLSDLGYVRAANLRERSSYYTLSEPLYAIWHQMRFGRDARQRMQWLVNFLKVWYDAAEMGTESVRLEAKFRECLTSGRMHDARNALDHRRYLTEAMDDSSDKSGAVESIIRSYLELGDRETLQKELLTPSVLSNLSDNTLGLLLQEGCISQEIFVSSKLSGVTSPKARQQAEFEAAIELTKAALNSENWDEALLHANRAFNIAPDSPKSWAACGLTLLYLGKWQEAFTNLDRICEAEIKVASIWAARGIALNHLGRHEEAVTSFIHARSIDPNDQNGLVYFGSSLTELKRYDEATVIYEQLVKTQPDNPKVWFEQGITFLNLNKNAEATISFERSLEIKPDVAEAWYNHGLSLVKTNKYEEAITSLDHAIEIEPQDTESWVLRGLTLALTRKYQDAVASYDCALDAGAELNQVHSPRAFTSIAAFGVLMLEEKLNSARQYWDKFLDSKEFLNEEEYRETVELISETFLLVINQGNLELIKTLISESGLEQQLFPLARAIDYLLTGDKSIIEKLSPEVQGVVNEIVAKFEKENVADKPATKSRKRKSTGGTRGRTKKQLR